MHRTAGPRDQRSKVGLPTAGRKSASSVGTTRARRGKTEDNLEKLLTVAAGLMARQGYEQTSIRDVARETGFSLAGMYYYVKGKEELLYKIQDRTFGSLLDEQEHLSKETGTAEERFRRLVRNHLSYLAEHAHELKVCTFELDSLQGEYYKRIERLRRRYFKLVATIIEELTGDEKGRIGGERDTRHYTLFVFGMLNWTLMWFDPRRDAPTDELANRIVDFVLRGLPGKR
jgi:AcrR family transcriptional regulator